MEAYSSDTDKHYPNWEALVEAESNGYVVVGIIAGLSNPAKSWPWVTGPYPDKAAAQRARVRARNLFRKQQRDRSERPMTATFFVRPAWKDER